MSGFEFPWGHHLFHKAAGQKACGLLFPCLGHEHRGARDDGRPQLQHEGGRPDRVADLKDDHKTKLSPGGEEDIRRHILRAHLAEETQSQDGSDRAWIHVGRELADERLRGLGRDALLVGSPGCGKTALLARLVADGAGLRT